MKTNSISAVLAIHARTIATTRQLSFRRAWLWTGYPAFAAIAFGPPPAQAAVTEAWVQRYSNVASSTTDRAVKVVRDAAGDIIVTGTTAGGFPGADMLTMDGSGNVAVTGVSNARLELAPNGGDYYTAKYAADDGALLWEKLYNRPANASDYPDYSQDVAADASGNVVITGQSPNETNDDFYTAKYAAADGALLWEKRYDGSAPSDASAREVAVDGSGNVAVTGVAYNYHPDGSLSDSDHYTAKYAAADGALLWERRYNGPANDYDQASAVAVDGPGNVVVTGSSGSDFYTAKYAAADGSLLWEKQYNSGNAIAVVVDGSGNVVVTGTSFWWGGPADYYTAKYAAADGALLWEERFSYGFVSAVAVDRSGNVVVTGSSTVGNTAYDYYTAKYAAANGALLWERGYNGPANGYDAANAVAVDGSGNVVVTGNSEGDYYTAKYAAADGTLLWERRYSSGWGTAVAVDGSGNVVVTGTSYVMVGHGDYYTAKYAAADGALLWEKRFQGPGSVGDSSRCLALGPDGMVVVTGTANAGYATVVYRDVPAVSLGLMSTGVRLRVTGLPGRSYSIERAPAVTGPWSTIHTQTAPASGLLEYLDTNPTATAAFYRTREP